MHHSIGIRSKVIFRCFSIVSILLLAIETSAAEPNTYSFSMTVSQHTSLRATMQNAGVSVCGKNVLLDIASTAALSVDQLHEALPLLGQAVTDRCPNVQRIAWKDSGRSGDIYRATNWQVSSDITPTTQRPTQQLMAENRLAHYQALAEALNQYPKMRWDKLNQDINETEYIRLLRNQTSPISMSRVMRLDRQGENTWQADWPYPAQITTNQSFDNRSNDGLFYVRGHVQLAEQAQDQDHLFLTLIHAETLEKCHDPLCSNIDLALTEMRQQLNDATWTPADDQQLIQPEQPL